MMYDDPAPPDPYASVARLSGPSPEPLHREVKSREVLPVQALLERQGGQVILRIPLRAEQVRLEKRTVVTERVAVRRERSEGVATVSADLKREQLRVDPVGEVEVTRPFDPSRHVGPTGSRRRRDQDATQEW